MQILSVIPVCRDDAARAELLLDLIYQLEGRKTIGHSLLVFAPEVHQEMRDKLKLAASLAFESVNVFDLKQLIVADKEKHSAIWGMFQNTAQHIAHNYRYPWLWLEPDCMPLVPGWRDRLWQAYDGQPKRYLSRWVKAGEQMFCHRIGIYPVHILNDIESAQTAQVAFDVSIVDRSTKSDLFQQVAITSKDDVGKIRQDAVLVHPDKNGVLADWVRSQAITPTPQSSLPTIEEIEAATPDKPNGEWVAFGGNGHSAFPKLEIPIQIPKSRGRPPKVKPITV